MLMVISRRSYKLHYETSQSEVFGSKTAENLLRVHSKIIAVQNGVAGSFLLEIFREQQQPVQPEAYCCNLNPKIVDLMMEDRLG